MTFRHDSIGESSANTGIPLRYHDSAPPECSGDSPADLIRRPGSVPRAGGNAASAAVPFPLSAGPLWKALLMAAAPLSCSTFDYSKPAINVNDFRQKTYFSDKSAASSSARLSPYTGMPADSSSSAVTPSPAVNPPEKPPSWIVPLPQEGLRSLSTAA